MKNIDKNILYLGWVSFFTDMASNMITTLLPIFVVYVLHEGVDKLGVIIAIATFISYIFRILFGYLSERYGLIKPFVVTGYALSAVSKPLLAFAHGFGSVALLRGVERMGKSVRSASKDALISHYVKEKAHGKTFGFHKMMDISGELSGALIILVVFIFFAKDESTIRDIFLWTIVPGVIATFIAIFFVKDAPSHPKTQKEVFDKNDLKLLPLLFLYFGFIFFLLSDQYFILKAKESGYGIEMIALFVMILTLTQAISSYYSGIMSDIIGVRWSLVTAFIFGMTSILMLPINLWVAFIFLGLFTVVSLNTMRAYISARASSKSFVYGIFYGGVAICSALGALVVGYLWKIEGFEGVFYFSELGMAMVLLLSLLLPINQK